MQSVEIVGIILASFGIGLSLGAVLCTIFAFKNFKNLLNTASKNMEFGERMRKERDDYQRRYDDLLVRMDEMADTITTEMEIGWDIEVSDDIPAYDAPEE